MRSFGAGRLVPVSLFDVTLCLLGLMSYQPSITMRLCWPAFAVVTIFFATPSIAEQSYGRGLLQHIQNLKQSAAAARPLRADGVVSGSTLDDPETFTRPVVLVSNEAKSQEPDIDIFALISGKCSTLKIAGRDFTCRGVAYFHSEQGRANFTVNLDDPADSSHVVSFSGENAQRDQNNLYELSIDRMLLNSKDRPRVDGLPVPFVELSAGTCKQLGNIAVGVVSSISCAAMDKNGKKYELQFESDGSPITVRRLRQSALVPEKRRAKQIGQLECRHRAEAAKVLPRDRTAYIIGCLAENGPIPAADAQ
jgi:hypothetical protein